MSASVDRVTADSTGPAALPRRNGELVFDAPWQSRAFGLAVALADAGSVDYEEFRAQLIADIAEWEGAHAVGDETWGYYERWLGALERLILDAGIASREELHRAEHEIAEQRAHDHVHAQGEHA